MKPADGEYVPSPWTLAVLNAVPPDVHDVGGVLCGPNTVNVTVPVSPAPPDSVAEAEVAIAVPAWPVADGELEVNVGCAGTTVSGICAPHEVAAESPALPL